MAHFWIIRGHLVEGGSAAGDLRVVARAINSLADLAPNRFDQVSAEATFAG